MHSWLGWILRCERKLPSDTLIRRPRGYLRQRPRRSATSSRATSLARGISCGSKDMADTRAWPPPPNFSASEARLASAFARFQGFVLRETFARTADALTLTE